VSNEKTSSSGPGQSCHIPETTPFQNPGSDNLNDKNMVRFLIDFLLMLQPSG
jgi:hypothetical protein